MIDNDDYDIGGEDNPGDNPDTDFSYDNNDFNSRDGLIDVASNAVSQCPGKRE